MAQYIYINGYPGVGKFTVAKELEKLMPGSKVYHNHLLIDPVAPLVDRSSPHYRAIRTSLRRHVLEIIATSEATKDVTWIFTDSASDDPTGGASALDYQDAAARRGVPFLSVVLWCDLNENLRRVVQEGRGGGLNTKLTDPEIAQTIRLEEELYRFGGPSELELDTTSTGPIEAARQILAHISRVVDTEGPR